MGQFFRWGMMGSDYFFQRGNCIPSRVFLWKIKSMLHFPWIDNEFINSRAIFFFLNLFNVTFFTILKWNTTVRNRFMWPLMWLTNRLWINQYTLIRQYTWQHFCKFTQEFCKISIFVYIGYFSKIFHSYKGVPIGCTVHVFARRLWSFSKEGSVRRDTCYGTLSGP